MKTSVNLYFNAHFDTAEKLKTIRQLGYDAFYTGIYDSNETLSWQEQIRLGSELGLELTMIHCQYDEEHLNDFWLPGASGDAVCAEYIRQIEACGAYTPNFVVHLHTENPPSPSAVGLTRLQKMLAVCEKYGVNLCVENLYSAVEIPYIFTHLQHPFLKICYDSGHQNWLTPTFEILKTYHQYVAVLHLHQNDGTADQHQILSVGSAVFQKLVHDLPLLNDNVMLAAEIKISTGTCEQILTDNLHALQSLAHAVQA